MKKFTIACTAMMLSTITTTFIATVLMIPLLFILGISIAIDPIATMVSAAGFTLLYVPGSLILWIILSIGYYRWFIDMLPES